jgi:hypothetical protein
MGTVLDTSVQSDFFGDFLHPDVLAGEQALINLRRVMHADGLVRSRQLRESQRVH